MADPLVLVKTKRSSRQLNGEWEDYVKLKVFSFTSHSIQRYYLKDITSDRLCFFKVQYVPNWKGIVLVYVLRQELKAYKYLFSTREVEEIAKVAVRLSIDLDDIDTHCFLGPEGILCFGNSITYIDFSTSTVLPLDKYGSVTPCANSFPDSLRGACMRKIGNYYGVYAIYAGNVTYTTIKAIIPMFSFVFPMDTTRIIRVGGRVYKGYTYNSYRNEHSDTNTTGTIDIYSMETGLLEASYEMPHSGVVCSALTSNNYIYFLWNVYSHALRLNTVDMSIRLYFLGDYFVECVKVLFLHSKRRLRLPLGLVREICAFLAESKKVAERLSELVI